MDKLTAEEKTFISNFLTNLKSTSNAFIAFSVELDNLMLQNTKIESNINGDGMSKLFLTDSLGVNVLKDNITRSDIERVFDSYERMYNLIKTEKIVCQP